MKEVIRKTNKSGSCAPTKPVINRSGVTSKTGIANELNKFSPNRIGQKNPNCTENI